MELVLIIGLAIATAAAGLIGTIEGFGRLRRLYELGGEQHWDRLGDAVELLHGHDEHGQHVLEGRRQGVWLHVSADGPWMVVRGRIDAPLPSGLQIRRRARGLARRSLKTGNPLLDGSLHISGPPEAAALLQDASLVAPLLEVVHAWPESHVDERYVVLRYPDALGRELEPRCAEVVALVRGLRSARSARRESAP